MIYLLTLGWQWFAGASALGALIGFLSYTRDKEAVFSGGWVALLGVFALAALGSAAAMGVAAGRDAVSLDIAFLAGVAYAVGIPIGGRMKSLSPAPGGVVAKPAPRVVAAAAPIIVPEPLVEPVAPAREDAAPPAAAVAVAVAAPAPRAQKPMAGVKPETIAAPRAGGPDDLSRIKGIGPKSREKLNALGVFHYDQIASWNLDNAKWVGAAIGAPGRVERDKWIQQARSLAGAGTEKQ